MTALEDLRASFFILPLPAIVSSSTTMGHFSPSLSSRLKVTRDLSRLLQYDYMERLDGKEKWSVVESPRERRSIQTVVLNEAVFVQYLDAGAWHLAFYNDGREREMVSFSTNIMGESHGRLGFVGGGGWGGGGGAAEERAGIVTQESRWRRLALASC